MLIRLAGGRVVDPVNNRDAIGDLWIRDGRIIDPPEHEQPDEHHDVSGKIVMAGAIDIHSHIAGGNVNTARMLLPEAHSKHRPRPAGTPLSTAGWSTFETGVIYAQMGFTTVIEPAIVPQNALHAHLELADIPIIDKGTLSVLGNDDFLLSLLRSGEGPNAIADYVGSTLNAANAIGIKCINAGAATAFKYNVRAFSLDDVVPAYGMTSRQIVEALQQAVDFENPASAASSFEQSRHSRQCRYGARHDRCGTRHAAPSRASAILFLRHGRQQGFSSAAARLAEAVNANKNVTVDIGQVMFRQTVTISSDVMRQYNASGTANPKKSVIFDGDSNGGGIVPYVYRSNDFYNVVQWASGLELFLLTNDPMRVFFTTDHPNGAPFTTYPDIFALLMDRDYRAKWIADLPAAAIDMTTLRSISREYTLQEVAIMTRAAPAKLLGLTDRGHLGAGALADVAVYHDDKDRAQMFRAAHLVFKDGDLVVREGRVIHYRWGRALKVNPGYDTAMDRRLSGYYDDLYGISRDVFKVRPHAVTAREHAFEEVACVR